MSSGRSGLCPSGRAGTRVGHRLECGAQVTGGYFGDPGWKDVPDPANIGFPIAEVSADGTAVITKAARTGGLVTERTVKEQILYEMHDPTAYLTPDVVLDITDRSEEHTSELQLLMRISYAVF